MSKLNMSKVFKDAHAYTRRTTRTGDSYSATFAICLKIQIEIAKKDSYLQGTYKNLGNSWGAFIDGKYDSRTKSCKRPVIGDKVTITTRNGIRQVRIVKAISTTYASGTVVELFDDAEVAAKAQARYNAETKDSRKVSKVSKAQAYDDLMNEGGEGFNPYRNQYV